jgi:hypothetical protein
LKNANTKIEIFSQCGTEAFCGFFASNVYAAHRSKGRDGQGDKSVSYMASDLESSTSASEQSANSRPSSWLKVGIVAASSVLVGGLAVAWFYRKTLAQLRQAESSLPDSDFRGPGDDPGEDG